MSVSPGGSGSMAVHANDGAQQAESVRLNAVPGATVPRSQNVLMSIVAAPPPVANEPSMNRKSLTRNESPPASMYSNTGLKLPAEVGVPLTTNVFGSNVRPGGRDPAIR